MIVLHTFLQSFKHGSILLGSAVQNILLLLFQFVDGEEDLRSHVVHFGLLLEPVNDVWQVVQGHFDGLGLLVQFCNEFVVVANLVLALLQLVLVVIIALIMKILDLLLDLLSPLLEVRYLRLIEQLQLLLHVADLLRHRVVLLGCRLPRSRQKLDDFEALLQVIQFEQYSDVFLSLVVHDVDFDLRILIPLILLFLLLAVRVAYFLNHSETKTTS